MAAGARLVVNSSASPYHRGKGRAREAMVAERARQRGGLRPLQHGGRPGRAGLRRRQRGGRPRRPDARAGGAVRAGAPGLRSDAGRRAAAPTAPPPRAAFRFSPSSARVRSRRATSSRGWRSHSRTRSAEVYAALTSGLRDYVEKNGFEHVVIALSGGIDSALVALIAVDALGAGARQRRRHALPQLQRRDPGRRPGDRREPRGRADRDLDRGGDGGLRSMRSRPASRAPSPAWPRRTCRHESGATW